MLSAEKKQVGTPQWLISCSARPRSWSRCLQAGLRQRRKVECPSTHFSRGRGVSPDWYTHTGRWPSCVRWPTVTPAAGRGSCRFAVEIDVSDAVLKKCCLWQAPILAGCAHSGARAKCCRGRYSIRAMYRNSPRAWHPLGTSLLPWLNQVASACECCTQFRGKVQ